MFIKRTVLLTMGFILMLSACKKDDPVIPNEEELITTLRFVLTPSSTGDPVEFIFRDLDGEGGQTPEITNGVLVNNITYSASIELLNEIDSPAEDITQEVMKEALEHQLFYEVSSGLNLNVVYNDLDSEGNPVGLITQCSTGDVSSGPLTITLRHEPNKSAAGVSDGDITGAGGETDIQVTFNVAIQ